MSHLLLFTDGGSRGNPGPAGCGAAITDEKGKVLKKLKRYLGITTNNVAEYEALILGLEAALSLKPKKITCYLDSKLVVEQMKGNWKVKKPHLKPLQQKIFDLLQSAPPTTFHHVPREKNELADRLANEAMDSVR